LIINIIIEHVVPFLMPAVFDVATECAVSDQTAKVERGSGVKASEFT